MGRRSDKNRDQWQYSKRGVRILDRTDRSRQEKRAQIAAKTDGRCAYCGVKVSFTGMTATIDHVIPLSRQEEFDRDLNDLWNLVAACKPCNEDKADHSVETFREIRIQQNRAVTHSFAYETVLAVNSVY